MSAGLVTARDLQGRKVFNASNERIGQIEEALLDLRRGRIGYFVVSFPRFLDFGDLQIVLPWDSLALNTADDSFVLDVDRATLQSAPAFRKGEKPDLDNPDLAETIHRHFGVRPYWERSSPERVK